MTLRKTKHTPQTVNGLSLLQGLFVLAVLGIVVAVVVAQFVQTA